MATDFAMAPGEFLQEWIKEEGGGILPSDLAERLGVSCKHINRILSGKAPISPELALKLENITGIPRKAWLAYEALYQKDRERLTKAERKWMEKMKPKTPVVAKITGDGIFDAYIACPECGREVYPNYSYCPACGQHIEW